MVNEKILSIIVRVDKDGKNTEATIINENGLSIYSEEWKEISKLITKSFIAYPDKLRKYENILHSEKLLKQNKD